MREFPGEQRRVTNVETSVVQPSENGTVGPAPASNVVLQRTLIGVGIVSVVSAITTYFIVRNAMRRPPLDETSERIQQLIDEANRLLRTLDERQKNA